MSVYFLSISSFISIYPSLLLPPLIMLIFSTDPHGTWKWTSVVGLVALWAAFVVGLAGLARMFLGNWDWVPQTWLTV
jgi:hypothetical protein